MTSNDSIEIFVANKPSKYNTQDRCIEQSILYVFANGAHVNTTEQITLHDHVFYCREHNSYYCDENGHYDGFSAYGKWKVVAPPEPPALKLLR